MLDIPNMIMIGGNSRNAGKTTLACRIIEKFAKQYQVIGVKVTSVRKEESEFHGNHQEEEFSTFQITEELNKDSHKDTSMMLRAGAKNVFYVRAAEGFESTATKDFLNRCSKSQPIICESRSLRNDVKPGLFIMMMRYPTVGKQKEYEKYLNLADCILNYTDDIEGNIHIVSKIFFNQDKFILKAE
jgi:hypothetical protein